MRKAQKKIAEQNLQKAIEVTIMFAENAVSEGKTFCICNVDVGLDVNAVREAVSKVIKHKVAFVTFVFLHRFQSKFMLKKTHIHHVSPI